MSKRRIGLLAIAAVGATCMALIPASSASALNLKGAFDAGITVANNGAADGSVSDTINSSNYITALTASGGGTCLLLTGEATVSGVNTGTGNPARTHTPGTCNLFDATAVYTLTWTSVGGLSGSLQVSCNWILGNKACSPGAVHGQVIH